MTRAEPFALIRPEDRLGVMLFLAAAIHAIVILGVSFDFQKRDAGQQLPTLEVTLVTQPGRDRPRDADYLAQANQEGGGNTTDRVRPQNAAAMPAAVEQPGNAAETLPAAQAASRPRVDQRLLTQDTSSFRVHTSAPAPQSAPSAVNVAEILNSVPQMARLSPDTGEAPLAFSQRPRKRYINANTREYRYAAYEEAWRAKIERVGNLNYPDAAKRDALTGSLILDVAINADGTVRDISVLKSSGHRVLDEAAINIVRLADPFAQFPEDIRRETDILHLVRTWRFESNRVSSR